MEQISLSALSSVEYELARRRCSYHYKEYASLTSRIEYSVHAAERLPTPGASQDVAELTLRCTEAAKGRGVSEGRYYRPR